MKDKLVILLAKIGVFFANCDGCYDQCEKNFIRNFIALLSEKNFIDSSTNEILEGIEGKVISIDIVIQETKSFVDLLQEIEKDACLSAIEDFIERLIKSDGVIHAKEAENFALWKRGVRIIKE